MNARYPLRTRIIIVAVVAVAVAAFAAAFMTIDTGHDDAVTVSGATGQSVDLDGVDALVPGDGAQHLSQQKFGIDLADGWVGELTLQPADGSSVYLPPDELERSALNELLFQPGDGRVLESLPSGQNCVAATIWNQVRGRDASERVETWCFTVV